MIEMRQPNKDVQKNTNLIELVDAGFNCSFERGSIVNYSETSDGINIQLATGMNITHSNYNMPIETKRTIIHAIQTFGKVKKTKINLRDYKNPILLESK